MRWKSQVRFGERAGETGWPRCRNRAPVLLHSLHWARDATMREDASKVRSGSAPRALATMRNLVISVLRLAGVSNIAQARRHLSRRPEFALTLLGV